MPTPAERTSSAIFTEQLLSVGDTSLFVRDSGGVEPAIVFLHGQASSSRWWDFVVDQLARSTRAQSRLICIDHRGHGRSDRPAHGYTVDDLASDVYLVLTALRLHSPVLVGHSLGAAVALQLVSQWPDAAAGVACVDGGVFDLHEMFGQTWEEAAPKMQYGRRGRITPEVIQAWVANSPLTQRASVDDVTQIVLANYENDGPAGLRLRLAPGNELSLAHSLWHSDRLAVLAKVHCPVGVVAAKTGDLASDGPRQRSVQRAREILGDRLFVRWIDGGHELPIERPHEVVAAIVEFMDWNGEKNERQHSRSAQ